ncbi:TPA: hypothetical protein U5E31_001900 [Yersinia enterocolitica]|nr:hypothetical protein [Yersinia mollaretii]CNI66235.1 Uncharacterised protein [Yersinia frederiksenii]HDL8052889.1 hypothetical protein [Yersinia enterocolitica]HDM8437056.1 hypothetical protein [Yersinia enterocolitica]HEN3601275.1 hypothetical protein [Yersinia enterocolitica]HEN3608107.1 hypothetical protein [Yersinia enterocolitica]
MKLKSIGVGTIGLILPFIIVLCLIIFREDEDALGRDLTEKVIAKCDITSVDLANKTTTFQCDKVQYTIKGILSNNVKGLIQTK